ncbi:DNA-binding protein [Lysinibacillus fusiformis]|uniref:DNA-binding protein n=1 Tax=Lysinibacillus fusiformis TaxID=28031 RepID=UPI0023A9C8D0|nr:DNA-binding protein [Lysinibacillus fusiformis]WEA41635.1 DNA-binding protein [Lysinibacillus fusiformis]
MQNNDQKSKEGLTIKEISETLNVAEITVYKYIEKELLEEIEQPNLKYAINRQRLFTSQSVLNLKERMTNTKNHISLNAYAKEKKVSPELLKRIIANNGIVIPKGSHGLRQIYLISPEIRETLDRLILENSFAHFRTKKNYYNSHHNIALLQSFLIDDGRTYRVMTDGQRWGFYTETGFADFESFTNAKPLYDIHKPTVKSSSYVNFSIPKNEKNAYPYVDAIYKSFGIENAQILLTEEYINVRIKMNSWKVANDSEHVQRLLELNNFTNNGEIQLFNQVLHVICFDKRVKVVLEHKHHEQLSEIAKKQNITESKLAERIIEEYLKKHQK